MLIELVKNFVQRVNKDKLPLIGVLVTNGEDVLFEHTFKEVDTRNIFSHSKSFTSIAIGKAVEQGYISLDTKVTDVFKDELDGSEDPRLKEIELRHLLTMSSGFDSPLLFNLVKGGSEGYPDYLKYMLSQKVKVDPGSKFFYSNGDIYLATRMVEKRLGKPFQLWLFDEIFTPLGMGNPVVQTDLQGRVFGASGYHMSLKNQAKIANSLLKCPKTPYFEQMKRAMINTGADSLSDGYGYQFWVSSEYGTYRADGMFGQVTMVFESLGLAVSYQCMDDTNQDLVLKTFEDEVLKPLKNNMERC